MNHRKHKQSENVRRPKRQQYNPYSSDPLDAVCPYCGKSEKSCSYVNSVSRARARDICKKINT
jgi:hypothetical protein